MLDQHIAGQPQQVVGMVDDVGHDDARLAPPLVDPVLAHLIALAALAKGQGEAYRRAPARLGAAGASCCISQSCTASRR